MADPKEYRRQAKRCLKLAADTNDTVLKDNLIEAAQRWERLAADLEANAPLVAKPQRHKQAS
jgi:hypothetical protein